MHSSSTQAAAGIQLNRKGKLVVGVLLLGIVALLFALAWSRPAIPPAVAGDKQQVQTYRQIVVQPGDTLWGISSRLSQGAEQAVVLDHIVTYNDLASSELQVGQRIYVPVYHP